MRKIYIVLFLFLISQGLLSQTIKNDRLSGKILLDTVAVEKVNVTNTTTNQSTLTSTTGSFTIPAKAGDVLVFSAINLETKRKVLGAEDLSKVLVVQMATKMTRLKEVKVNENAGVTAENLGIIPYGQKKYSLAERKLHEATTGGGIVPLNPILNAISGRTTMLKKEIQVERKEKLLNRFDGLYEENYYTDVLKIPQEYIKGFQYYLIEDPDFAGALQAKNKTLTMFYIKKLALNYNQLIQQETK